MGDVRLPAACLFDFDGVLVDSFATHVQGWAAAYRAVFAETMPDCPPENLTGQSSQAIAGYLCGLGGDPGRVDELYARKTGMMTDGSLVPPLRAGVREVVAWCRAQRIPHAVGSNAPAAYLRSVLAAHGLQIPVVLGFDNVARPKPAPDLYLRAAELCGADPAAPEEILVFEDSPPGITAAVRAGMYPVGILARTPEALLRRCGARAVYADLAAWLEDAPPRGL